MRNTPFLPMLLIIALAGCSAAGVPYTSDPLGKIQQARYLINVSRPLPAERLITNALDICQKEGNENCIAGAYLAYGELYMSDAYYMASRYAERKVKTKAEAFDYYQKAYSLFEKHQEYTYMSVCLYEMGKLYEMIDKKSEACKSYSNSLITYSEGIKKDPSDTLTIGKMEFSEGVKTAIRSADCDKIDIK